MTTRTTFLGFRSTDRQRSYNAAYTSFCALVGKRLPAAAPLTEDELYVADVHDLMLAAQRELEEPTALTRMLRRLRLLRTPPH